MKTTMLASLTLSYQWNLGSNQPKTEHHFIKFPNIEFKLHEPLLPIEC